MTTDVKYNYSIVIPHYRTIDLLLRCVRSIPRRDDIQVIVVDDNSGIDKDEFNRLGFIFPNQIVVFSVDGGGAGYARNVGLKYAMGKWLLFADADDFFLENAFDVFDQYLDSCNDIVYFDTLSLYSDSLLPSPRNKIYNIYISECDNSSVRGVDAVRFGHSVPYAKMIRRRIVADNDIRFDETKYCNDTMFSIKTALCAAKVYVDKRVVYCVTSRCGSLITHKSLQALLVRLEVILRVNKLLRENGYKIYQNSVLAYLRGAVGFGYKAFLLVFRMIVKYRGFNVYTLIVAPLYVRKRMIKYNNNIR